MHVQVRFKSLYQEPTLFLTIFPWVGSSAGLVLGEATTAAVDKFLTATPNECAAIYT